MNEYRRIMRVSLPEPLPGVAADETMYVLDASLRGVRISHRSLFSPRTDIPIHFQWDGKPIDVTGTVRWTRLQQLGSASYVRTMYQSGVEIVSIKEDTEGALRGLVLHQVELALDERKANAKGVPPYAARFLQTGEASTYARHEFVNGVWRKIVTKDARQPVCGFTVSTSEARDQIEILRSAYEIADTQMKRVIQKVAELTISNSEGVPMRRYTP
jgi:PilZ domain